MWWDESHTLWLITPAEYRALPKGMVLQDIFGDRFVKGKDNIDMDTRAGHIAYGFTIDIVPIKYAHKFVGNDKTRVRASP
jgi:hypothetical protein